MYGTSPVGNKSLADRNPHRRLIEFMTTVTEFLSVLPNIVQFQQADIMLDGFLWSKETYDIVKEAAEKVYLLIHQEAAPWIEYQKNTDRRNSV